MAIEIEETLRVDAPLEAVWRFVMDPERVVTCMPGAQLEEAVDERTFLGAVKVKVGAITTSYRGRVEFARVDAAEHSLELLAEARETGGGTARGRVHIRLRALPEGATELVSEASIDLTGRIMQVGRGMIRGVSHQLFKQFAASAKQLLEAPPGVAEAEGGVAERAPIRAVPLILRTLWSACVGFLRRLLGRPAD